MWASSVRTAACESVKARGPRCVLLIFQRRGRITVSLLTAALLSVGVGYARGEQVKQAVGTAAPVPQLANDELLKNMQCMEQRLKALEAKLKAQSAIPGDASEGAQGAVEPPKPFPMRTVRVPENGQQAKTAPASDTNPKPLAEGAQRGDATRPATESTPEKSSAAAKTAADPCLPTPTPKSPSPMRPTTGAPPLLPPLPAATGAGEQPLLPPLPAGSATPAGVGSEKKSILGLADSPVPGLSIGAYGEIKYGSIQNPNAAGQWQNGFDAHRLVLLPTYAITPNIIFNAEIEFEHGGIAFDSDDKLHGSVDVEQIFVDFLMVDWLNWRSPGIDLVPIGYINQHHEPTQFYSVKRPELYNGLIPSTWRVPATSIYGTIVDGIKYQLQMSSSLEDFGDDFGLRTDANTVPLVDPITGLSIPYAAGITGLEALGLARPVVGDFRQLSNVIAYAGKLDFTPPFLPGLGWSVSAYYTPNTTPRGAHDNFGNPLGGSSLTMFDAEFRYRIPNTWVELRGEYVRANFGSPVNLRANNDGDPFNNVGRFMYGYSGEIAFHIPLGTILNSEWKLVPFYRYTYQQLQAIGYGQLTGVGGTELGLPTGAGQTRFQDFGLALFPSPKIVLKATYQRVRNNDPLGAQSGSILGGVGFFF
jgi:hypothetical protein